MKLKCLFLTVAALLFLFNGCNKDAFFEEEPDINLKSAELKWVPIKGDINAVITKIGADNNGIPLPVGGIMEGNVSHLGKINEGSKWDAIYYVRHSNENPPYIEYVLTGKLLAANGDELIYTTEGKLYGLGNEDGLNWVAKLNFTGGTGRFENATGECDVIGWLNRNENGILVSVFMQLDGKISSVGSSK